MTGDGAGPVIMPRGAAHPIRVPGPVAVAQDPPGRHPTASQGLPGQRIRRDRVEAGGRAAGMPGHG